MHGARSFTLLNKVNNEITLVIVAPKVTHTFIPDGVNDGG